KAMPAKRAEASRGAEHLAGSNSMRDRIKAFAEDLLIRNGYRGTSFGLIANQLNMTRANIHYHFGNKKMLVEEVLHDYVTTTSGKLREIWTAPDVSLIEKIELMTEYS